MKICGIELKANNVIFTILEIIENEPSYINSNIKKISLLDDENQDEIKKFKKTIDEFIKENHIDKIVIKKRAKKGTFAGGVLSFKIEAIIQLNNFCGVDFISSQAINKFTKNNEVSFPSKLKKYQEQAYLSALITYNNTIAII